MHIVFQTEKSLNFIQIYSIVLNVPWLSDVGGHENCGRRALSMTGTEKRIKVMKYNLCS